MKTGPGHLFTLCIECPFSIGHNQVKFSGLRMFSLSTKQIPDRSNIMCFPYSISPSICLWKDWYLWWQRPLRADAGGRGAAHPPSARLYPPLHTCPVRHGNSPGHSVFWPSGEEPRSGAWAVWGHTERETQHDGCFERLSVSPRMVSYRSKLSYTYN